MTKHVSIRADLIVATIDDFQDEYGHPPSVRQIASRVGLASTSAVHHHLRALVRAGRLSACECGCGTYRLTFEESGPGFAYFDGDDSPAEIERKMADAFAPVAALRRHLAAGL